ncbi:MAG: tetratricopeptide repeat protein [Proteobacteria bacterium]|nr:tetratricopeptide repeat protein [Pseudomonadota bacterium]
MADNPPREKVSLLAELQRRKVFRVGAAYAFIGWLFIQVGADIFPALEFPHWALPLLIWLVLLGFPVALVVAWAYELTSRGVEFDQRPMSFRVARISKVILVLIIGLTVSIIGFSVFRYQAERLTQINSLAVLPFKNLSSDPAGVIFAEGLAEELLSRFSRIKALKVPGRRSTKLVAERSQDLAEMGKTLGVQAVLEGGVRWSSGGGNEAIVKIDLRLLKVADGLTIWTRSYTRRLDNIFELQEEIATEVVGALQVEMLTATGSTVKPTFSVEAYELYLKGRAAYYKREYASMIQSIAYYEQAIAVDPDFAKAYSSLAEAWVLLAMWGYVDASEAMRNSLRAAQRALQLDDSLPGTQVVLGSIAHWHEWNNEKAEPHFRRAIKLDPNYPTTRNWYSVFLAHTGRAEESLSELELALRLDPVNPIINAQVAYTYLHAGRFEEAVTSAQNAVELDPGYIPARYYLGWGYQMTGQFEDAIREYLQVAQPLPLFRQVLAQAYAAAGRREEAMPILDELMETRERGEFYVPAYFTGVIYTQLGDFDQAFKWLDLAVEERSVQLAKIEYDPYLIPLHDDPRFDALKEKIWPD